MKAPMTMTIKPLRSHKPVGELLIEALYQVEYYIMAVISPLKYRHCIFFQYVAPNGKTLEIALNGSKLWPVGL